MNTRQCWYRLNGSIWSHKNGVAVFIARFMLLLTMLSAQVKWAAAQQQQIDYRFVTDTVLVERGTTFSNKLVITNHTKDTVHLSGRLNEALQRSMLKIPADITIGPGESRTFPVKFLAESNIIQEQLQEFSVSFIKTETRSQVGSPAIFFTKLEVARSIVIGTPSAEVYLPVGQQKTELSLRLLNNSLISQTFSLDFEQVPEGLEISGEKGPVSIKGGEELMRSYLIKDKRGTRHAADFSVIIRAVDAQGIVLDRKAIRVMSLSNRRSLGSPEKGAYGATIPNTVSVNYLNANTYSSVQLAGNGNYELGEKKHLAYNLNAEFFTNGGNSVTMYNSFVDYQTGKLGIKAGNIYEDLDFNVNGIGAKGSWFPDDHQRFNVYGLKNSYLLYADRINPGTGGNTFAAEYLDGDRSHEKTRVIALYNDNVMNAVKTNLLSGKKAFLLNDKNGALQVEGGISSERYSNFHGEVHNGFALGADYSYKNAGLLLNTRQFYGSPFYGGMRRGMLQSENMVSYGLSEKMSVNGRVSILDNRPKYLVRQFNDYLMRTNSYGNQIYEIGFRVSPAPHWQLGVNPYYFRQSLEPRNYFPGDSLAGTIWHSGSARAKLNASYSAGMHHASLIMDQGYTYQHTAGHPAAPFYSTRINLDYSYSYFGVDGFYQHNPYYLSDVLVSQTGAVYNVFSVGMRSQFNAIKDKLGVNAALRYYNYGYNNSQNYVLNVDAHYWLPDNWAFTASVFLGLNKLSQLNMYDPQSGLNPSVPQYTGDQASLLTSRRISIGISKRFGKIQHTGERRLTLIYFEDRNGNGEQDAGEPLVSGLMVKIDDLAAVTDKNGRVTFDAPAGKAYIPAIVSDEGWTQSGDYSIFLARNSTMRIPLVKSGRLSGQLQAIAGSQSGITLSGIRIRAVNASGKVYQTFTDNKGNFNFYLPENSYSVSVDTEGLSIVVEGGSQQVAVQKDIPGSVIFPYTNKRVEVDIKKF